MPITVRVIEASEIDLAEHTRFQLAAFAKRFSLVPASTIQSEAYYRWKYHTPAGEARVAQAFENGKLVGSASAVPVRFAGYPPNTSVWQVCDLAIDRTLRRRGIFSSCVKGLLARIGRDEPIYTLPNALSLSPLLRAGFAEIGRMRFYATPRPLLGRVVRKETLVRREKPSVQQAFAGQGLDLLDTATMNWRFRACPIAAYRLLELGSGSGRSVAVLRTIGRRLHACALVALRLSNADDIRGLGAMIADSMRSHKEAVLMTLSQDPPPWASGSFRIPEAIAPRRFPILALNLGSRPTSFTAAEWDVL
jgi:hypothetical protein